MRSRSQNPRPLLRDYWPTRDTPATLPAPAPATALAPTPKESPFLAALAGCAESPKVDSLVRQEASQPPPLRAMQRMPLGAVMLKRVWSWLHTTYAQSTKKQLRVAETASLGEKRFVAIIHAEGCKFLIGGGASGVSLLKQLGPAPEAADDPQSVTELTEYSE